jgi:hypothetical protein
MTEKKASTRKKIRISEVDGSLKAWGFSFFCWTALHYILGIGGTILAATVASKSLFLPDTQNVLAWLSALCVGLLTMLAPLKKAKLYHSAWSDTADVYYRYLHTSEVSPKDVLIARHKSEQIVTKFFDL